jgi:hypothetical protein
MIFDLEHFIKKYHIKIDTTQPKYFYFEDLEIDNILDKIFSRIYYLKEKSDIVNIALNPVYFEMMFDALHKKSPRHKDYYEYTLSGDKVFSICGYTFIQSFFTEKYKVVKCIRHILRKNYSR